MNQIESLKKLILAGGQLNREQALSLYDAPLEDLCTAANEIRVHFCGSRFDMCAIINGKSGRCSEDCT